LGSQFHRKITCRHKNISFFTLTDAGLETGKWPKLIFDADDVFVIRSDLDLNIIKTKTN